jgi:hypothetical protein
VVLQVELGTFQLPLLIVELFLLVATVSLLVLNRREQKAREKMIDHFSSVADVITRQEYFVAVVDGIQRAERSLSGSVSGSPPTHEEGEVIQQILDAIADAARKGVKMRYLLPLAPDRLQMGKRYKLSGAEVRFHPSLLISDMRYMLVDDRLVLVGVPERKGRNEPTRKGFTIPSESVAHLFKAQFEAEWSSNEARGYQEYLGQLVTQARVSNPSVSVDLVAGNLGVDREDVEAVARSAA